MWVIKFYFVTIGLDDDSRFYKVETYTRLGIQVLQLAITNNFLELIIKCAKMKCTKTATKNCSIYLGSI